MEYFFVNLLSYSFFTFISLSFNKIKGLAKKHDLTLLLFNIRFIYSNNLFISCESKECFLIQFINFFFLFSRSIIKLRLLNPSKSSSIS